MNEKGKLLPNNIAVFVKYSNGDKDAIAVIESDSSIDNEFIDTTAGGTEYHTVVTVFELEIMRRQPTGSAIGKKHPNTSNELPSAKETLPQINFGVKFSLKNHRTVFNI